jgi:hypothetical protein
MRQPGKTSGGEAGSARVSGRDHGRVPITGPVVGCGPQMRISAIATTGERFVFDLDNRGRSAEDQQRSRSLGRHPHRDHGQGKTILVHVHGVDRERDGGPGTGDRRPRAPRLRGRPSEPTREREDISVGRRSVRYADRSGTELVDGHPDGQNELRPGSRIRPRFRKSSGTGRTGTHVNALDARGKGDRG